MKRLKLFILALGIILSVQAQGEADSLVFRKFLEYASKEQIVGMKTGDRIATIAKFFLDTPYVAFTLEGDKTEQLRVNMQGLDCMTLVENVLALHHVLNQDHPDFSGFKQALTAIRYRNGQLDAYPSRLHYTTDWLLDNQRKGFIRLVNMGVVAQSFQPRVGFMSAHPEAYTALKTHPEYVGVIAEQEKYINSQKLMTYVPKEKVKSRACYIRTGDIVAITSSVPGIDFSHLGIALRKGGEVYLLHASSTGQKVLISSMNLRDYLAEIKKHTGIVVARPL